MRPTPHLSSPSGAEPVRPPTAAPRGSPQSVLDQILDPASPPAQRRKALRTIKHAVTGNLLQKQAWVRRGALEAVAAVLRAPAPPRADKAPERVVGAAGAAGPGGADVGSSGWAHFMDMEPPPSDNDCVRLEALQILASLAKGGPQFLPPIHATQVLPSVFSLLSPLANPPQVVLGALRVLFNVADAAELAPATCAITPTLLADNLFAAPNRTFLEQILSNLASLSPSSSSSAPAGKLDRLLLEQVNLVATLIAGLCRQDYQRVALANGTNVTQTLAALIASVAVAQGRAPGWKEGNHASADMPRPAPWRLQLAPLMDAVSAIITGSKYRMYLFLWSPAIRATFPDAKGLPGHSDKAYLEALANNNLAPTKGTPSRSDLLAPPILDMRIYARKSALFRTLREMDDVRDLLTSFGAEIRRDSKDGGILGVGDNTGAAESRFLLWLVHQLRAQRKTPDRLAAAYLFACFLEADPAAKPVLATMASLLVVPPLMEMLRPLDVAALMVSQPADDETESEEWCVLKRAPAVLAKLAPDSELLQKTACECKAAILLATLIKKLHTTPYNADKEAWWCPEKEEEEELERPDPPGSRVLGDEGVARIAADISQVREGTLAAIAALAADMEECRNTFLDEGILAHVAESLAWGPPLPGKDGGGDNGGGGGGDGGDTPAARFGPQANPPRVLVAACNVIRFMARSPNVLRTALGECDVAALIFRLLSHPDLHLRAMATSTICNLVTKLSPLRQPLIDMGLIDVFCQFALSDKVTLQRNALWALKHLVDGIDLDAKKACMQKLGINWLMQRIVEGASKNDDDDDVDMNLDLTHAAHTAATTTTRMAQADDYAARLEAMWAAESDPLTKALENDQFVQEQCLDFLRNFLTLSASDADPDTSTELVDGLFQTVGSARFFKIMFDKLQAQVLTRPPPAPAGGSFGAAPSSRGRATFPRPPVVAAVIYVLVHVSASVPRHRWLVIQQTRLLELILAQAVNCTDPDVRCAMCWLVSNLACNDGCEDVGCEARIAELCKLGFKDQIQRMRQDENLDVKQRANEAFYHLTRAS